MNSDEAEILTVGSTGGGDSDGLGGRPGTDGGDMTAEAED